MGYFNNLAICRMMVKEQRQDLTPEQKLRLKGSYVYGYQRGAGDWEFQNPQDGFYWHGHADNAADARYHGTEAWLRKFYPDQE